MFWSVFILGFIIGDVLGYVEGKSLALGLMLSGISLLINYTVGEYRKKFIKKRKL
ncbi:hypothetical protein [Staphylococcus phage LY01]|nr:hypothetical protein [Staphylococcus phage LY01]